MHNMEVMKVHKEMLVLEDDSKCVFFNLERGETCEPANNSKNSKLS